MIDDDTATDRDGAAPPPLQTPGFGATNGRDHQDGPSR